MFCQDVLCNLTHEGTVKMKDGTTLGTLQVQMIFTVKPQINVLVDSLIALFRDIFHDGSVIGELIQIPVNSSDVDLVAGVDKVFLDITDLYSPVAVIF